MASATIIDTFITRFLFQTDRAGLRQAETQLTKTFTTIAARARTAARAAGAITTGLATVGAGVFASGQSADRVFTRMKTHLNLSDKEIASAKKSLTELSRETAQPLAVVAEAYLVMRSNSIAAKDSLEFVRQGAKGAAAELGSAAQMADLASSAFTSLGERDTANIIMGAVKGGKIPDAGSVTPVVGQLLPYAAQLGITLEELLTAIGGYSRQGIAPSQASNALRGIMGAVLAPTPQGIEILKKAGPQGITVPQLHKMVKAQGLLSVLQDLRSLLSLQDFTDFIGRIESTGLALDVSGSNKVNYDQVAATIEQTKKDKGIDKAMDIVKASGWFKAALAVNNFRLSLQMLYDTTLVPILTFFSKLPPLLQNLVVSGLMLGVFNQLTGMGPALLFIVNSLKGLVVVLGKLSGWLFGALLGRAAVARLTRRLRRMVVMGLMALLGGRLARRMAVRLAIIIGGTILAAIKLIPLAILAVLAVIGLAIWAYWDDIKKAIRDFVAWVKAELANMVPDWVKRIFGYGPPAPSTPTAPAVSQTSQIAPVASPNALSPPPVVASAKTATVNIQAINVTAQTNNPQALAKGVSAAIKTQVQQVAEDVNSQVMF